MFSPGSVDAEHDGWVDTDIMQTKLKQYTLLLLIYGIHKKGYLTKSVINRAN